ncbi:MAG: LuxR family transcriptional regulator, partial [Rhodobacterales bacterium]
EPAYTALTAAAGAALYDLTPEDFAARTSANFDRLFTKAARAAAAA